MNPTLTLPYDQVAAVAIGQADAVMELPGIPAGASATSSDATVVAAAVSADGSMLTLVPAGQKAGSATVTVSAPGLTPYAFTVNVVVPTATKVTVDVADATFSPLTQGSTTGSTTTASQATPAAA